MQILFLVVEIWARSSRIGGGRGDHEGMWWYMGRSRRGLREMPRMDLKC